MASGNEDWRKNADTTNMSSEEIKRMGVEASKRPPGHNPGEILHQRRGLPYNMMGITLAGTAMVGALWYFTIYTKKKPEATAGDVARVAVGVGTPEDTHPTKSPK